MIRAQGHSPIVCAVNAGHEASELGFVLFVFAEIDHIDCHVVLLETFTESHQIVFRVRNWGTHESDDPLPLVLVFPVLQR